VNASLPPGQWQSFDITFRAPRFDSTGKKTENARFVKVVHNGKVIHENEEVTAPPVPAALRMKSRPARSCCREPRTGAFRNILITPLATRPAK
jgi:hypothetical protein